MFVEKKYISTEFNYPLPRVEAWGDFGWTQTTRNKLGGKLRTGRASQTATAGKKIKIKIHNNVSGIKAFFTYYSS